MNLVVNGGGSLQGAVSAPPSKSYTHRAFIISTLAEGKSKIFEPLISRDTLASIRACEALGAVIERRSEKVWCVSGSPSPKTPEDVINVDNSGTTIRIMTAVSSLAPGFTVLTGDASIRQRPMGPLIKSLGDLGVRCFSTKGDDKPPIVVEGGGIKGGKTNIPGHISSQFISALLIACPLAKNETRISFTSELKSEPYLEMTMEVLSLFKGNIKYLPNIGVVIPPKQTYSPASVRIPGDFSSAAFILSAAAITDSDVKIHNLDMGSKQGDKKIVDILIKMGAEVELGENYVRIIGGHKLKGISFDCGNNPDLLPILAVLGSVAEGKTDIFNAQHVRYKESDRVSAMAKELSKMGIRIDEKIDGLTIHGGKLKGAHVETYNDHRILMALAVAALAAEGETIISGVESVDVSYPSFLEDMNFLGASFRRMNKNAG
ncbi:MAG: 3-phosphoshikimate 1-carboxyvinyltransferase [Candidatus Freyarchaeota archaeon]|nr:3-phosphoshikimate 1-carboxyvinyltransferase [Candidatus Jordarchaeia archaeon]MBS7278568.1 3-phosphoshikimate 1-carboxyvinyltransferase [Candidatus Jordarchaeia archaeon]